MIARADGDRNLEFGQHLHPFVNVDQLWNGALRVRHIQKIPGNADQVVAIGDAQKPFKPWSVEMKIGRKEEFHLWVWSR